MNMHWIDWSIVAGLIAILTFAALSTRRYTKSVSAFLAAERCGGRYLLSVANGIAQVGVITLVSYFEQGYEAGFTAKWWGFLEGPVWIFLGLSGWVYYRYRQTRAMTLAQFFEMRYSKNFRIFAGLICFLSGIVNFGIFPAIGARFFIWLCGLPDCIEILGLTISMYPLLMFLLLSISLVFTFLGGQIAIMITDFLQGSLCNLVFAALILFMLLSFDWSQITDSLLSIESGKSAIDPYDVQEQDSFNIWFYLIGILIFFYGPLGWQGTAGYNCSAKSAHEMKMATIIGGWRWYVLMLIVTLLPICVRTYMTHPDFAEQATVVVQQIEEIGEGSESVTELQRQARTPLFLGHFIPIGFLGLLCAAFLGAFISTHDTYLHSWGSMFIQDVVMPFKKKKLSTEEHIKLLRKSIFGVAIFIFLFSLILSQVQHVIFFTAISAAIFTGAVGIVIIGGLYWKRGTTRAAWVTMTQGMILAGLGFLITQGGGPEYATQARDMGFWQSLDHFFEYLGMEGDFFPLMDFVFGLNGQVMTFWIIVISVVTYVLVSLFGPQSVHNMDKLLHRGQYAIKGDESTSFKDSETVAEKLGITKEFTKSDKVVACITLAWPLIWFIVFVVGSILYKSMGISDEAWLKFWHFWTWLIFSLSVVVTLWFIIGGYLDIRYLYRKLAGLKADQTDDGSVEK